MKNVRGVPGSTYFFLTLGGVLALIIDRINILFRFSFNWIDDDQAVMWLAARDYSRGVFHEPRFYGQDYNTHLESLLAVPLYLLGLELRYALPIITSLLAIAPFLYLAYTAYRSANYFTAIFSSLIPLSLSFEYGLFTSMPRGFVTGVALAGVSLCIIDGELRRNVPRKSRCILSGFLALLSLSVNPNSIVLLLPAFIYYIQHPKMTRQIFGCAIMGSAAALLLHAAAQAFYLLHPSYDTHNPMPLAFGSRYFFKSLSYLESFWAAFSPFVHNSLAVFLLTVTALLIAAYRTRNIAALTSITGFLLFIIFSLAVNKVHDGSESIYQPLGRMFLGIPVFFAFVCLWLESSLSPERKEALRLSRIAPALGILICITLAGRLFLGGSRISDLVTAAEFQVQATTIAQFERECTLMSKLAERYQVEVIALSEHRRTKILNYGCPVLFGDRPLTIFPQFERRTWRVIEEMTVARNKALLYEFPVIPFVHHRVSIVKAVLIRSVPRVYYIEFNPMPLIDFLKTLGHTVREANVPKNGDRERSRKWYLRLLQPSILFGRH